MAYYKAAIAFTHATVSGMIVGDPEHPDPRGRVFSLNDDVAGPMVSAGLIKKSSKAEYDKAHGHTESDAGEARVAQTAGKRPNVSARMTNDALAREAAIRGVDVSKAKNRSEVIHLINSKETSSAADEVEGTDNAWSRSSGDTNESTLHDRVSSPQNNVGDNGTVNTALPATAVAEEALTADEDEAPSGGDTGGQ